MYLLLSFEVGVSCLYCRYCKMFHLFCFYMYVNQVGFLLVIAFLSAMGNMSKTELEPQYAL